MNVDDEHAAPAGRLQVSVTRCVPARGLRIKNIEKAARAALAHQGCAAGRVNVALVDDARIADLNRDFLNHTGPTDVITFDLRDLAPTRRKKLKSEHVDGEIVMSVETAIREARSRGHSATSELMLYTVHGILHLLGYDDSTRPHAARMHKLEDQILSSLGFGPVFSNEVRCGHLSGARSAGRQATARKRHRLHKA